MRVPAASCSPSSWRARAAAARADWNGDGNRRRARGDRDGQLQLYARQRRRGLRRRRRPSGSAPAGARSRGCCGPATSAATAGPTCSRRTPTGACMLYRGNGAGGWVTGTGEPIGSGWDGFTAVLPGGDFSGDGKPDVLARRTDGVLLLYRGERRRRLDHRGGRSRSAAAGSRSPRWCRGGDFSGDGRPDVLARRGDGDAAAVPRRRRRRLGHRHGRADRQRLGRRSRRSPRAATSAATAGPTSSPASPTARCCSTAATGRADSWPARASRSARAGTR